MQKQRLHKDRFPRDVGLRAAHLAAGQWGLHCSSCRLRIKKLRTSKSWRIHRRWWKRYPSCICMGWVACYHSIKSYHITWEFFEAFKVRLLDSSPLWLENELDFAKRVLPFVYICHHLGHIQSNPYSLHLQKHLIVVGAFWVIYAYMCVCVPVCVCLCLFTKVITHYWKTPWMTRPTVLSCGA